MVIKVASIHEKNRYLAAHPHKCRFKRRGTWRVKSIGFTVDFVTIVKVQCQKCEIETSFEFDESSAWPREFVDMWRKAVKRWEY